MATGKVRAGSFSTAPDSTSVDQFAVSRRKELINIPWTHQLVMEGRCYHCDVGTLTTPISWADTALDSNQPRIAIDVPSGTTIIPMELKIHIEDQAGTNNEYIWITQTSLCGLGTDATEITPLNMRTDMPATTTCTVYSIYTNDCATQTGMLEFARFTDPFVHEADAVTDHIWSALASVPPVVVGPGSLIMIADGTGTAPGGFIYASWAEMPTNIAK